MIVFNSLAELEQWLSQPQGPCSVLVGAPQRHHYLVRKPGTYTLRVVHYLGDVCPRF